MSGVAHQIGPLPFHMLAIADYWSTVLGRMHTGLVWCLVRCTPNWSDALWPTPIRAATLSGGLGWCLVGCTTEHVRWGVAAPIRYTLLSPVLHPEHIGQVRCSRQHLTCSIPLCVLI